LMTISIRFVVDPIVYGAFRLLDLLVSFAGYEVRAHGNALGFTRFIGNHAH